MLAQPQIRLEVKDSEGWFGPKFPEDVDELHFQVVGVIKEVDRLKGLFDLFAAVLDRLCCEHRRRAYISRSRASACDPGDLATDDRASPSRGWQLRAPKPVPIFAVSE